MHLHCVKYRYLFFVLFFCVEAFCKMVTIMPIDPGKKISLSIEIPADFKAIHLEDRGEIKDFIPSGESASCWSRMIITEAVTQKSASAQSAVAAIKDELLKNVSDVQVLQESNERLAACQCATLVISYQASTRREILLAKYYSGQRYCAGFQYKIALSDSNKDSALAVAKAFVEGNVKLV